MHVLNEYLQELLSTEGSQLCLEPNKQPYVVTTNGNTEISNAPLPGAKINTMIFALIPNDVKKQLPNNSEVKFVHPHNLGDFNFVVKKSPSGFIVNVSPPDKEAVSLQEDVQAEQMQELNPPPVPIPPGQPGEYAWEVEAKPQDEVSPQELEIEHNSPPNLKSDLEDLEINSEEVLSTSDYVFEDAPSAPIDESLVTANDKTQSPGEYPKVAVEQPAPIQETYDNEQIVDVSQFSVETDDNSSYPENSENMQNNFDSQNPSSINNQPVLNTDSPAVENVTTQNQSPYTPQVQQPQIQEPQMQQPQAQAPQVQPPQVQPPQMQQSQAQAPQIQQPVMQAPPQAFVEAANEDVPIVPPNPQAKAKMDALFHKMNEVGASDLHMSVSVPPMVRNDGKMALLDQNQPALTPDTMKELLQSIMPQKNIEEFAERKDTDFAYEIKGLARFRANIFMDRKGMGGVFRIIPSDIMTAEDLKLSKHIMDLCDLSKGLVVVTGPTGSGKSTTLCAMVDSINKQREDHIITIEDPIEFTHENQKCLVNQREVHNHTDSFKDALRAALREDPDILLVGEMRDLETISIAIETAETGHLVFGTLHTTTAASTVDRIIDQFPADRQQQVRVMLSESLRGVIAQTLLPKIGGGRIAALEVLIITPAISNLIREGKTFQIPSSMQTGKNKGMVMLNDALMDLVNKGLVEAKDAYVKSVDKEGFEMLLKRNGKSI